MSPAVIDVLVDASPDRVFRALTDTGELETWFAEHADVALDERRYDFWGRHTPYGPDRDEGRHPIITLETPRLLTFAWNLRGTDTEVELALDDPTAEGTTVRVVHTGLPGYDGSGTLEHFWGMSLENLEAWVDHGRQGHRGDWAAPQVGRIEFAIDVDAPQEQVSRALMADFQKTNGEQAEALGESPFHLLSMSGTEISYRWDMRSMDGPEDTIVNWSLADSGGRTRITIVHSGFGADDDLQGPAFGWIGGINNFKLRIECGEDFRAARIIESSTENVPTTA